MSKKASPLSVGTKIKAKTATLETAKHTRTTAGTVEIAPSSSLNTAPGDISATAAMQAVKIKKELPSDEIKEFAENTMNELLGWYGFDGVDRLDLSTKTSRLLQSAAVAQANNAALTAANSNCVNNNTSASNSALSQQQQRHCMEKRRSRSRAATLLQLQQQQNEHLRNINNNSNNSNSNANNKNSSSSRKITLSCGGGNYRTGNRANASALAGVSSSGGGGSGGAGGGGESTTSDHDTRSSREEDSKSPISAGKNTTLEEKIDLLNCCWCRRPVPENAPEFLTTTDGPRYCSESCFTQSRRASFKKAKTCDWCKHVRHAISYVDFQDGASQLQFCSDKCLNQYKMQIFCKETQAHLDMNPHLREQGLEAVASGNGAGLITPDLWLRNCRSRSASPASTISVSPGPQGAAVITPQNVGIATGSSSSPASSAASNVGHSTVPPHKPMISVAPVSKLMSKSVGMLSSATVPTSNRVSPKHNRKKRPLRSSLSGSANAHADLSSVCMKGNHLSREGSSLSGSAATNATSLIGKGKSMLSGNGSNSLRTSPGVHLPVPGASGSCGKTGASVLNQFAGSSVQDLHMSVPPLSPMMEQQSPSHVLPSHPLSSARCGTNIPPAFFATTTGGQPPNNAGPHQQIPHGAYPPHPPPFLSNAGAPTAPGLLPRFFGAGGFPAFPLPPHVVQTPPDMMGGLGLGALLGAPPPVTVMVPYPIVIPLPIPIPVPLPVMDFYKAYMTPEERTKLKEKEASEAKKDALRSNTADEEADAEARLEHSDCEQKIEVGEETVNEEPLDFTKTKNCMQAEHIEHQNEEIATVSVHSIEEATSSLKRALSDEHLTTTTSLSPATPVTPTTNTTTTTAVTPSPDRSPCSPATSCKATHCIVRSDESATIRRELSADIDEASGAIGDCDDAKQKLPKFKITRLQTKRTLIQTKETPSTPTTSAAECSRPLRKRKRIIDCDFQKLALKELTSADGDGDENADLHSEEADLKTTGISLSTIACNNNTKAQSKK
uniref:Sine oculis-binding protein-like protein n=2 Tax=Bactrocera dorsalis TaxID=27457 RepID=A0A034VXF2_BACDO